MAQLKSTTVAGSLRATDTVYADTVQTKVIEAPTASNGTTYGPGTSGQVLKSNGSSVYWATDNNAGGTVTSVRVQATSPVTSSVNTAQSATLNTTIALANGYGDTKNPYAAKAKNVVLAGPSSGDNAAPTFRALVANDLPDASTSAQGVVQLSDATNSTSTTLAATANAVKKAYDLANGKTANTGTVTKVSTGAGLTGGDITTTGTVKANLTSETKLTNAAADGTETSGRVYPVRLDKNGKLAVNVPWTNVNSDYLTAVTASNHYTPAAASGSELTAAIDGSAGAYAKDTEYTVLTGVKAQRDAKGHVTGLTYTAQKVKDTNTTYESKAAASGGTAVSLVTTGEKYTWNQKTSNTGTVTKVSTGAGLTGGDITSTGTVKAALTSETKLTNAATDGTETSGRVYPVRLDKNGKLAVNVPWSNSDTKVTSVGNHYTPTTATETFPTVGQTVATSGIVYIKHSELKTDAAGHTVDFTESTGILDSESAASGGTTLSLVTTGEKATWNAKTTNTGTVTKVSTGAGLTGGDITSSGTVKAALTSETKLTNAAADGTETSGRVYPVRLDKNGKLAVNVPWTNVNSSYLTSSSNLNADKLSSGTVPVARLPDASTSAQGVVQLSDATNSTSTTLAATANAVKKAYDLANGKTANTGTVTSVKLIQGNNITINSSGTAITTSGERTISLSNVQHPLVAASSTAAKQTSPYKPSLWAFNLGVAASSLATGMMVTVKIPVATTNYGSFISIDNGTTYKPIAVGTGKARLTTHYSVDDVVTLFYDASGVVTTYALAGASNTADISGGCWRVLNYYDSGNSNDTATMYIRHNHGTFAPTTALYAYELCLQSFADNAKLIPVNTTQKSTANSKTTITTAEFDPFADIIYYSRDATVNANTNIGVSYVWLAYSLIDLRYSFNIASTLTANKDIYIVAKMQDNGSAKLRNPGATGNNAAATATGANAGPITQTLPTSDDGYIYIKLGRAYDSYRCSTDYHHQIYWYKNGKVRLYPDTGCPICKYGPSSAFSSLPVTFENDSITADMVVLNYVLSNPTAQINNWTVTTAAGSLTISGQVRGSTTITLYLGRCEQEA